MRRRLLALAVLAIVPAGCSADDSNRVSVSGAPAIGTYVSTNVGGYTLAPGTRITLTFAKAGELSANAGCNHMGGKFSMEGTTLVVGEGLAMTEMGCDEARHNQDQWLANLLTARPTLTVDGDTVTVTAPDATITLQDREVADPDRPLTGTRWHVDTVVSGDTAANAPTERPAVITFADGTVRVDNGCTSVSGRYEAAGDQLTFGELHGVSGPDCPLEPAAVLEVLRGAVRFSISADRLTLSGPGDEGIGAIARE